MVSLYSMVLQATRWTHLTTLIPSLDKKLFLDTASGVYDLQSVPNCKSMYVVLSSIVLSHLLKSTQNNVIIIYTLDKFPTEIIKNHKKYDPSWFDTQIKMYKIDTISKLAIFLEKLSKTIDPNTLVIIDELHDLIDLYRLDLLASYQEALLKFQAMNNALIVKQWERYELEGIKPNLVKIPKNSALIREAPVMKYSSHLHYLFKLIAQVSSKDLLVIITGHLAYRFESRQRPSSNTTLSSIDTQRTTQRSQTQSVRKGTLAFANTSINLRGPNVSAHNPNVLDSIISKRVMFYKDWFHKSQNVPYYSPKYKLKMVFCLKLYDEPGAILYFDFNDPFYRVPISEDKLFDFIELTPKNAESEEEEERGTAANNISNMPSSPATIHNNIIPLSEILHDPLAASTQVGRQIQNGHHPPTTLPTDPSLVIDDSQDLGSPL